MKNVAKKVILTLEDGRELVIPDIDSESIPVGFRRKTRHLKGEQAEEELFFLMLEHYLTAEELDVWDTVPGEAIQEAMEKEAAKELLKESPSSRNS